ncbi:MAG: sigma-70 family RNA polymerase sigma factor [Melioribacteraceae bacterium]|nr:sigma-70 family RNA polymerase sigma factor [Melioribacteraceae bacterium]MCF8355784.1 sigma-70 family RNA polymerase sigma factor [Melioribacteraceae bacterium]MCF8392826.1 sigma-70 family RNA polymerase sigma factor [Melioribacteraceae bacterium]MCF8418688.1 sigma-70 family RNA polymerase sigma factor [Melioribacteraceae bacterium]
MKRAYFSALGFLGSHDEAMDASQAAFIRAYGSFDKFDRSKNFFTWYYKILRNYCLNVIRDNKKFITGDFLEWEEYPSSEDTEINLEKAELKNIIETGILELSEMDREVIILREFQDMSYQEISEILQIPVGTVMSKLFYARKKLGKKLEKYIK